jgi:hypothetical protein
MRTDAPPEPPLSPELALIDDRLRAAARDELPAGGEGELWRLCFPPSPPAPTPPVAAGGPRRGAGLAVLVGAAALCAAATSVAYASGAHERPYLVREPAPLVERAEPSAPHG